MATRGITIERIREIAREEDAKVIKKLSNEITSLRKDIDTIRQDISSQCEILKRLERLLLGEEGTDIDDTLKARANFAYQYAKRNTELKIIERAVPALDWFEDMSTVEPGEKESKLDTLGRVIGLFTRIEWVIGLIGVTTVINTVPVIKTILDWIQVIGG